MIFILASIIDAYLTYPQNKEEAMSTIQECLIELLNHQKGDDFFLNLARIRGAEQFLSELEDRGPDMDLRNLSQYLCETLSTEELFLCLYATFSEI